MAPRLKCVRNIENLSTAIYKTRQKGVANAGACVCAVVCVCGPCVRENLLHFSDGNCNRMCFTFIITKWIMTAWTGASLPCTHTHAYTHTNTLCWGRNKRQRTKNVWKMRQVRCRQRMLTITSRFWWMPVAGMCVCACVYACVFVYVCHLGNISDNTFPAPT